MTSWMLLFIDLTASLGLIAIGLSLVVMTSPPQQAQHSKPLLQKR